ncbi:putative A-kinase anchor protein 7 isoform gamma [Hypsibius exemplaris]|uniref:A-kinase anchor protein 7 isoform gamma n=1 Tax=Hypsibius exemplaris TaxID=2072580 RepID=A0A1W0WHK5_HYPEX|nr:putative A-kinase anchor protein 7 isoform gamma [Hypsibius exemplaris]
MADHLNPSDNGASHFSRTGSEASVDASLSSGATNRNTGKRAAAGGKPSHQPNYFIAVPVSNPGIHEAASTVHQGILEKNAALQPAMVSITKSHITLMVLRLDGDEDIAKARLALDACHAKLTCAPDKPTWPVAVPFRGLSHFNHSVLYIDPVESDGLTRLHHMAGIVESCFADHGLHTPDARNKFTPHLTLMKLSKAPELRRKNIKRIHTEVYEAFREHDFGVEHISRLQLCSMTLPQDAKTGYYFCEKEVDLLLS